MTEPRQSHFSFAVSQEAQPDGSVVIRPGALLERLTPQEFADRVGVSRASVYRYLDEGAIDLELVDFIGPRKILIKAAALDKFLAFWRNQRQG